MNKERRHIYFYGYVQGVGFRFKASAKASRYGITGWVRNLRNGAVEMEAEGYADEIDAFIENLNDDYYITIERMESKNIPTQGGYSFEIL